MAREAWLLAALAMALAGCHNTSLESLRPVFPHDTRVQVACAEYPQEPQAFETKLRTANEKGWRLVGAGRTWSWFLFFISSRPYLCFERALAAAPAPATPTAPPPSPVYQPPEPSFTP